jgi:CubicO group peptidase (beta-lactamase class C family)
MITAVLLLLLVAIAVFLYKAFSIISGYGAKTICSNIFICDRLPEDIIRNELGTFPLNLGKYSIDNNKKTVTGSVAGMAKKTAVFRTGLGSTVINGTNLQTLGNENVDLGKAGPVNQDLIDWPAGNRQAEGTGTVVDQLLLDAALEAAFNEPGKRRRGTRAVIVVHDGKIVAERYAEGFNSNSRLAGWSMAKSITSALVGILVKRNMLDVHSPAPIAEWKNDARRNITIANLLQMSSGLRWWEYYAAPSDATHMLYNERDMGGYALRKRLKNQPGSVFAYSSGSTNILSTIIRQAINDDLQYYRFPYDELFYRIGMLNTVMEVDAGGTFAGSSYCFATARDWARFGSLYLNDGVFGGQRILPEGWVQFTTTPTTAKLTKHDGGYGAQWWLNAAGSNGKRKYPGVPADCFVCQGYEGQFTWVIPSEKLVVVRLALEKGDVLDPNVFLPAVIKAINHQG